MPHLINPGGRIVAVDDLVEFERLKNTQGFTIPTENQEAEFIKSQYALANGMAMADETKDSVYMATVSQGGKDGYGNASGHLIKELKNLGVKISTFNKDQKIGLLFHAPYSVSRMENPVKIIYTMFESDKIPDDWLDFLHTADKVLVPSRWCMEVFAKSGIQAEVVPLGYDDSVFSFEQRKLKNLVKENFTFLHYNAYNVRKGFLEVVKAFITEFDPAEPVRMIFKTVQEQLPALPLIPSQYPNIEIVKGAMEDTDLAKLCARADCFVYPSRGEGFGIPPLEAMATGMPAIVPNAHGISEYFDPQYMYEVKVEKTCPALYSRYRGATDEETIEKFGNMVVCDTDDLRRQMRYIYEHQRDAMEMGQRASEYVKNYTYKKTAERLKTIIDDYMLKEVTKKPLANVLTLEEVK